MNTYLILSTPYLRKLTGYPQLLCIYFFLTFLVLTVTLYRILRECAV